MDTLNPVLAAHQQRVVEEKAELDRKVEALDSFILQNPVFLFLDQDEQGDLREQLLVMQRYSRILGARVARFAKGA